MTEAERSREVYRHSAITSTRLGEVILLMRGLSIVVTRIIMPQSFHLLVKFLYQSGLLGFTTKLSFGQGELCVRNNPVNKQSIFDAVEILFAKQVEVSALITTRKMKMEARATAAFKETEWTIIDRGIFVDLKKNC